MPFQASSFSLPPPLLHRHAHHPQIITEFPEWNCPVPEWLREVMLENRTEVMMHTVIPRNINLENFDRQVLVGVRRAGKSYILYGRIQQLIANVAS